MSGTQTTTGMVDILDTPIGSEIVVGVVLGVTERFFFHFDAPTLAVLVDAGAEPPATAMRFRPSATVPFG